MRHRQRAAAGESFADRFGKRQGWGCAARGLLPVQWKLMASQFEKEGA